jgi:hypothetical protein
VLLLIYKSATKNYIASDLEINSQKLCRCRFRNQKPNSFAADSEIDS